MKPTRTLLFLAAALVCAAAAEAGHEITFYPSYYPHEIAVRWRSKISTRSSTMSPGVNTLGSKSIELPVAPVSTWRPGLPGARIDHWNSVVPKCSPD